MIKLDKIPPEAGIRRIGFAICYEFYRKTYGIYPQNPTQLNQVTTTIITQKRFNEYVNWWQKLKDQHGDLLS